MQMYTKALDAKNKKKRIYAKKLGIGEGRDRNKFLQISTWLLAPIVQQKHLTITRNKMTGQKFAPFLLKIKYLHWLMEK
jgi:hypothetical protein